MKYCYGCKAEHEASAFSAYYQDKKYGECRKTKLLNSKADYDRNKEKYRKQSRIRQGLKRKQLAQFIFSYLLEHTCVDCGESSPLVLEFDHIHKNKSFNISTAAGRNVSLKALKAEIEKCEVVCANCHRIRTSKEFNFFRYQHWFELQDVCITTE